MTRISLYLAVILAVSLMQMAYSYVPQEEWENYKVNKSNRIKEF